MVLPNFEQSGPSPDQDAAKWNAQNRVPTWPFETGKTYVVQNGKAWPIIGMQSPKRQDMFLNSALSVTSGYRSINELRPILGEPIELEAP